MYMIPLSLRTAAKSQGAQLAVLAPAEGVSLRYADLTKRVAAMWAALRRSGVRLGPSARIAVRATNRVDTLVLLLALNEAATPFVPLHPRLTPAEVSVLLADAQPDHVVDEATLSELAQQAATSQDLVDFAALPLASNARTLAILYTSGTSGMPKGALLSAAAFVASAVASAQNLGWQTDDRWLLCLPLCHVGGLSILTRCLLAAKALVLLPRADASSIVAAVDAQAVTLVSVVPTLLSALLREGQDHVLARLRAVLSGGAATPQPLYEQALSRGLPVLRTYGLTEACSQVTVGSYPRARQRQPGSGWPLSGVDLIIGPEGEDDPGRSWSANPGVAEALSHAPTSVQYGQPGRIWLRGPTLMTGYLHRPALAGGFFDTGDIGYLDAGFLSDRSADRGALHVLSRRTDLIVTGGENVYPAEVEAALLSAPGVAAALVFGVDDPVWGAQVAAALVPLPDDPRAMDDPHRLHVLAEHIEGRLASFKRPRLLGFVRDLPELANGKPDRRRAARELADQLRPVSKVGSQR